MTHIKFDAGFSSFRDCETVFHNSSTTTVPIMNCNQHISSHRHLMVRIYSEMLELVQSTPTRIDLHRYNVEPSIEVVEKKVYFVIGPGDERFTENMERRKARNNGKNQKKTS